MDSPSLKYLRLPPMSFSLRSLSILSHSSRFSSLALAAAEQNTVQVSKKFICTSKTQCTQCIKYVRTIGSIFGVDGPGLRGLAGVAHHLLVVEQHVLLVAAGGSAHAGVIVRTAVHEWNRVVALCALVAEIAGA